MRVAAIGVVVPVRDEAALLGSCLDAIGVAIEHVQPVPVAVVVVLDSCTDGSSEIVAARPWVSAITISAGKVGAARRAGAAEVLRQLSHHSESEIWLANTDADSVVPPTWLTGQQALAAAGWEAVVGTVAVADWSEHHPAVAELWASTYRAVEHHEHVHGANLGLVAAVYREVGGWPALPAHEDVELVRRLAGHRVVSTASLPVITSARRDPRASGGFGDTVSTLVG